MSTTSDALKTFWEVMITAERVRTRASSRRVRILALLMMDII